MAKVKRNTYLKFSLAASFLAVFGLVSGCGTNSADANAVKSYVPAQTQTLAFNPPQGMPTGKDASAVKYGQELFMNTHAMLPGYNLDALSCTSCHINGGTDEKALPLVGVTAQFPDYTSRDARVINLSQRINECFQRSGNGKPLPPQGKEMAAIEAYLAWISKGVPADTKPQWIGNGSKTELKTSLPTPNLSNGAVIFQQTCAVCHGTDGQGQSAPPLWGPNSFNSGAGMHNLNTMSEFVKNNMPASNPGSLSLQQAADASAYVLSQSRPAAPKTPKAPK
ncbi:c-type cytochrome [Alicyclobacillus curvatus]|nr:c-type cytochrome [Alicyclobacillus curvatus]